VQAWFKGKAIITT